MNDRDDFRMWIVAGAVGALLIGVALIPLRSFTSASNFAFVFLVFTIVLAELGGRAAGLTAAIMSAVSLNFFLTQPYLNLAIDKKDDIIAFFALIFCGLVASAFGRHRRRLQEFADRSNKGLDLLQGFVDNLKAGAPIETLLRELQRGFGLGGLVLRDSADRLLAAAPASASTSVPAKVSLNPHTLFPSQETRHRFGEKGPRLPEGGGRVRWDIGGGGITLDLWEGDTEGLSLDEGQTLAVAALLLAMEISRRQVLAK
ncbi:MAG: DUF4118 domain-containing protein [Deltaproteobacteria bacterium]|nr:DUF4118 domain-containing protein [Deltaproteobacteria bacterium]